jgi:glycosyltransferase involved in cell wall biosynthesis
VSERFKLLIWSDAPDGVSGLGRICRELALHIHKHLSDVVEVATYAPFAKLTNHLPFGQYLMEQDNLVPTNLESTCRDFFGDYRGAVLLIWNVSFAPYLCFPEKCHDPKLREFLESKPFELWGYTPIDGDCRPGMLPLNMAEALYQFDRLAHYTRFAQRITDASWKELGLSKETTVLYHGVDTTVFYPRNREEARRTFYARATGSAENPIADGVKMIGVVATNSERKSWPLVFEAAAELIGWEQNIGLWIHTDAARKHFDIMALAREYKLEGRIVFSRPLNDEEMAWCYSAMDCFWGTGQEGFGYPLAEALACGIPAIHMSYAGGSDFVPAGMQVRPRGFIKNGFFGINKPVFNAAHWAYKTMEWLGPNGPIDAPEEIKWANAWESWKAWILRGVNRG